MSLKYFLGGFLVLAATWGSSGAALQSKNHAPAAPQTAAQKGTKQSAAKQDSVHQSDEGQRVFEQNCSRCHADPDGFSSRISGTVLRHMRVRASLSKHDEQELLRFMNP
jgi:mono/diheme cytochrome c family protein